MTFLACTFVHTQTTPLGLRYQTENDVLLRASLWLAYRTNNSPLQKGGGWRKGSLLNGLRRVLIPGTAPEHLNEWRLLVMSTANVYSPPLFVTLTICSKHERCLPFLLYLPSVEECDRRLASTRDFPHVPPNIKHAISRNRQPCCI
jgi:hypothetical protein